MALTWGESGRRQSGDRRSGRLFNARCPRAPQRARCSVAHRPAPDEDRHRIEYLHTGNDHGDDVPSEGLTMGGPRCARCAAHAHARQGKHPKIMCALKIMMQGLCFHGLAHWLTSRLRERTVFTHVAILRF